MNHILTNEQILKNYAAAAFLLVLLAVIGFITENLRKSGKLKPETARKIFHISAGTLSALSYILIGDFYLLLVIGIGAVLLAWALVQRGIFSGLDSHNRKSWGILYLPISYIILLFLWKDDLEIAFLSMLILAYADSFAALAGAALGKKEYVIAEDKKTYFGSAVFFITSLVILMIVIMAFPEYLNHSIKETYSVYFILAVIYISFILMMIEGISYGGTDNLFVPVMASVLIYLCLVRESHGLILNLWVGALLSGAVAALSYRVKFLTKSGSVATFLLAAVIFGFGGIKWSVPIMAFFVLSSLLSKIRKGIKRKVEAAYFEKTGVRDHWQVAANGGLGGALVLLNAFHPADLYYIIYVSSLSAVCADTWATELGTLRKTSTYNVLTFRRTEQGMSGGVSLPGTLGGMLGSFVIALSGIWWIESGVLNYAAVIVFAGVFGSYIDSVLGSAFQAQFKCEVCGKITEKNYHCKKETAPEKGLSWLNNDMVNFLSGVCGGIVVIIFKEFIR